MIGCRPNTFAQSNIGHEAQITIGHSQRTCLCVKKHVLNSHQIATHLSTNFSSPATSFFLFGVLGIWSLRNSENAGAYTTSSAVNQNVWLD